MEDVIVRSEPPKGFSKEKSKPAKKSQNKNKKNERKRLRLPAKLLASFWWIITIITFVVGLGGLIYVISKLYFRKPLDWSYALIVTPFARDVQMVVYYVKSSRELSIRMEKNKTFRYHIETEGVNDKFKRNFEEAESIIPWLSRSSSPVIYAGGFTMRNIRRDNETHYNLLMDEIRILLTNSRLKYLPHYSRTLDDWEEALLGWITTNYLTDYLTRGRQPIKSKRNIFTTTYTLGTLDFDQSSMHITYEIPRLLDHIALPAGVKENTRKITLFGRVYYIYTQSIPCYGFSKIAELNFGYFYQTEEWNETYRKGLSCYTYIDDYTPRTAKKRTFPTRFNLFAHQRFVFESCSRTPNIEKYFIEHAASQNSNILKTMSKPNATRCTEQVKNLVDTCKSKFIYADCPSFTFPDRPYNVTFAGINGFAEVAILAKLKTGDDKKKWKERQEEICAIRTMDEITIRFPSNIANKKSYEFLCICMTYLIYLLEDKIKLSDEEWKKMKFELDGDNTRISWLLGYVLNVTNSLPTTSPFHEMFTLNSIFIEGLVCAAILTVSSVAASFALRNSNTLAMRPLRPPQ